MIKIDSAKIKWIAMLTMFIDHIGAAVIERTPLYNMEFWHLVNTILRMIGRIAFPLYCFLMVEAFLHTRSRRKYVLSMGIMALITEPIFDMTFFGRWYMGYQNVLFTLLIGFVLMLCLQYLEKKISNSIFLFIGYFIFVYSFAYAAELLMTDYGAQGVFLIAILYLLRAKSQTGVKCVLGSLVFIEQTTAFFAFLLIYLYNGDKGKLIIPNWMYRCFYPIHLAVLTGVQMIL